MLSGHIHWPKHRFLPLLVVLAPEPVPSSPHVNSCPIHSASQQLLPVVHLLQLHNRVLWQLWLVRQQQHLFPGNCQRANHWQLHLMGLAEQRMPRYPTADDNGTGSLRWLHHVRRVHDCPFAVLRLVREHKHLLLWHGQWAVYWELRFVGLAPKRVSRRRSSSS